MEGSSNLTPTPSLSHTHRSRNEIVSETTEDLAYFSSQCRWKDVDVFTCLRVSFEGEVLFDARLPVLASYLCVKACYADV